METKVQLSPLRHCAGSLRVFLGVSPSEHRWILHFLANFKANNPFEFLSSFASSYMLSFETRKLPDCPCCCCPCCACCHIWGGSAQITSDQASRVSQSQPQPWSQFPCPPHASASPPATIKSFWKSKNVREEICLLMPINVQKAFTIIYPWSFQGLKVCWVRLAPALLSTYITQSSALVSKAWRSFYESLVASIVPHEIPDFIVYVHFGAKACSNFAVTSTKAPAACKPKQYSKLGHSQGRRRQDSNTLVMIYRQNLIYFSVWTSLCSLWHMTPLSVLGRFSGQ